MNLTFNEIALAALTALAAYFGWHYFRAKMNDKFNAVYNRISNFEQDYYTAHERMHDRVFAIEKILNPSSKCCAKKDKQFIQD